jgi:hypothetical protein
VEVDGVHVLVDFTNSILTRTNWNELRPILIPGSFQPVADRFWPRRIAAQQQSASVVFIRFSSIDLKSQATVRLSSRPLDKEVDSFGVDRGLTTDSINAIPTRLAQMGDGIVRHISSPACCNTISINKVRAFLKSHLQDLKADPRSAIRKADRILDKKTKGVGGSILDYANDARRKKKGGIERVVKDKWFRVCHNLRVDEIKSLRER